MKAAVVVLIAVQVLSTYANDIKPIKAYLGQCTEEPWVRHKKEWQTDLYETVWYLRKMLDHKVDDALVLQCGKINRYDDYGTDMMSILMVYRDFSVQSTKILLVQESPEDGLEKMGTLVKVIEVGEETEPTSYLSTNKADVDYPEISYARVPFLDADTLVLWLCLSDDEFQPPKGETIDEDNPDTRYLYTKTPFTETVNQELDAIIEGVGNDKFEGNLVDVPAPQMCIFREFH